MTPQLQNLDGSPLSWPVLLERAAAYWHGRNRYGDLVAVEPEPVKHPDDGISASCRSRHCRQCTRFVWSFTGRRAVVGPCLHDCHGAAA